MIQYGIETLIDVWRHKQTLRKKKLNDKFNRNIHIRIINQCIDDSDYKFEQDLKYLNYQ